MFVNLIAFFNLVLPLDWFTFARMIGQQRNNVDTMSLGTFLMAYLIQSSCGLPFSQCPLTFLQLVRPF